MKEKNIELEIRAEIAKNNRKSVQKCLEKLGKMHSHTKRLSVMHFGKVGEKKLDIRIRVTNGDCEIVIKSGSFDSNSRTEISQPIRPEQFLGFVKLFSQLNFSTKVGERETLNYILLENNVIASLVFAGSISYIEIEKMSSSEEAEHNIQHLKKIANQLKLRLLKTKKEFDNICNRLDRDVDWNFYNSKDDYIKLRGLLKHHMKKTG